MNQQIVEEKNVLVLLRCACDRFYEPATGCICQDAESMAIEQAMALLFESPERAMLKRVRYALALSGDGWGSLIAGINEVLG